jgi:cell wall-associated NlpC family hydrolase
MQKVLTSILLVASLLTGGVGAVTAAEQIRKSDEQSSFFERYTNAAQDVILQGLKLVGVRYRFGGNDEDSGLDCSGFVRLVFKDSIGTSLPRTAREMSEVGKQIDTSQLKPGDLVFSTPCAALFRMSAFISAITISCMPRAPVRRFVSKTWTAVIG